MTTWTDLSTDLLPQVLQDFVRLIGLAATMILVEHFGGRRLYIPGRPHAEHPLAKLIGLENLTALSKVYGLEDHFDIPKAEAALRHLRNEKIRSEYGPKSASTLAREHQLTERQIWNIVGEKAADNANQTSLFG
jgi:Mor family transcriptional regulator